MIISQSREKVKKKALHYPVLPDFPKLADALLRYSRLAAEFGYADQAKEILAQVENGMKGSVQQFAHMLKDPKPDDQEPEDLAAIHLRPLS